MRDRKVAKRNIVPQSLQPVRKHGIEESVNDTYGDRKNSSRHEDAREVVYKFMKPELKIKIPAIKSNFR